MSVATPVRMTDGDSEIASTAQLTSPMRGTASEYSFAVRGMRIAHRLAMP